MKTVTIYTDGACSYSGGPGERSSGPGGWAAILLYNHHEKVISGGSPHTTNNRMEMTAVIEALRCLREPCAVELFSDSRYVIDALQKGWALQWRKKGWTRSDHKPALNPDLWETLLQLVSVHTVHYHWVRGHASDIYNNRCDALAVQEKLRFRDP